jgi:hypothetical protein
MKTTSIPFALAGLCLAASAHSQGTFQTITFDGSPLVAPGTGVVVTNYFESGMSFLPIPHPPPGLASFTREGAATEPSILTTVPPLSGPRSANR